MLSKVEYLGHVIDASGLHPMQEKVKAIQEVTEPKNLVELLSFLGMINYYSCFLPCHLHYITCSSEGYIGIGSQNNLKLLN